MYLSDVTVDAITHIESIRSIEAGQEMFEFGETITYASSTRPTQNRPTRAVTPPARRAAPAA